MRWNEKILLRLRTLLRRERVEAELDEEMRYHIERQIEQNIAGGMTPRDARRAALRQFGGVEQIKEDCRDNRSVAFVETVVQDLRYALRTLKKTPVFALVAVLTLALGVGATSAIFSVVNAVMLRPLPYPDPDRVVVMWGTLDEPMDSLFAPVADLLPRDRMMVYDLMTKRWQELSQSFDYIGWYHFREFTSTGDGEPERLPATAVSADFFSCFDVTPVLGRGFLPPDMTPGNDRVVILDNKLWRSRFGSDPDVVGTELVLDGEAHTIVGVLPKGFRALGPYLTSDTGLWVPTTRGYQPGRPFAVVTAIGRLKTGVTIEQAQSEMDSISESLESEGRLFEGRGVNLVRLDQEVTSETKPAFHVLLGAVGCVLLIACANLAGLMLARGRARQREIGVRVVLGASTRRLTRQLFTEALVVALAGGGLGLFVSHWFVRVIASLYPEYVPRLDEASVDTTVFAFGIAVTLFASALAGLVPGLSCSRIDLNQVIKDSSTRSASGIRSLAPRRLLVVGEVGLALMLLAGAGLLLRSFALLQGVDPGFDPERLLTMTVPLPQTAYSAPEQQADFARQVVERVRVIPSVENVAVSNSLPMASSFTASVSGIEIDGNEPPEGDSGVAMRAVTMDYFRTMSIPLLQGRVFTEADLGRSDAAIINEAAARFFWPEENPIGRQIGLKTPHTVIGVVADVKNNGLDHDTSREIYVPFAESPTTFIGLAVRTSSDPSAVIADIRAIVRELDPGQPLQRIATMREVLSEQVATPRFYVVLLGSFAALAVVLAVVGIYGVVAYSVSQRTREIGIRMALGARSDKVQRMVLREGAVLGVAGVVLGLVGAVAATRVLESYLFGVEPTDAATFIVVSVLLLVVCLAASYIPARRAARVDPMTALRCE